MEKTRTRSIDSLFLVTGTIETTDILKKAIKKLPEHCFDYVTETAIPYKAIMELEGIFLDIKGDFKIPDGATEMIEEGTNSTGSRVRFNYKGTNYAVHAER